jgi:hypothetical protein
MALFKLSPDDFEVFSLRTNPHRFFSSSSLSGVPITGSVYVDARHSHSEKDVSSVSGTLLSTNFDDKSSANTLEALKQRARISRLYGNNKRMSAIMEKYLSDVTNSPESSRHRCLATIKRTVPSRTFTSESLKKLTIKDLLMPHYKPTCQSMNWSYTNYNSLNFFTASNVPMSAALLYPNVDSEYSMTGYVSGVYVLSGAFSFDFFINPRYRQDKAYWNVAEGYFVDDNFNAGTIFHMSSCYAVSLITGSLKDENGRAEGFRVQLQLSHSADIKPSLAIPGSTPYDFVFVSDDNSLRYNHWHHVVIRWGTTNINEGTGSFNIDGADRGFFVVTASTIAPRLFAPSAHDPSMLCVGNYYEGTTGTLNSPKRFFATNTSTRDGLEQLIPVAVNAPTKYEFSHPLNAELHDLAIKRYYVTDEEIVASAYGPDELTTGYAFYLPPFFTRESPIRQLTVGYGGVPVTPSLAVNGTTGEPFNVLYSWGVGGHLINIENYTRDFANDIYPRLHRLTMSARTVAVDYDANEYVYEHPDTTLRNSLIVPCDDGEFKPSFDLLKPYDDWLFVDDLDTTDRSMVHLDHYVSESTIMMDVDTEALSITGLQPGETFMETLIGFSPEQPGAAAGPAWTAYSAAMAAEVAAHSTTGSFIRELMQEAPLVMYQRLRDASSNQIVVFDIGSLFYGDRIDPGSLIMTDNSLSGTNGTMSITLKDDAYGNLYRADCHTSAAVWNSVGNVFYDEGVVLIKSPHLFNFGKNLTLRLMANAAYTS